MGIGDLTFTVSGGAFDNAPQPAALLDPAGNILIDYCTPTYGTGCGSGDAITNVSLGALSNTSTCAANPYYTFFNAATKPALTLGNAYNVSVTMGTDGNQYSAVWIDFDKSGTFDATEYFTLGTNAGASGTSVIPFNVPGGANLGDTRMRVRGGNDAAFAGFGQACGASSSAFGETEDYIVTIVSPAPRSIDPIVVTQVTGGVARSTTNNNLLSIEIPVAGSTGSHTLSSIQMTYTGTAASDIAASGMSLWAGTSSAPTSQIGSSVSLSGGLANFTGLSAALNPGSNYFWIRFNTTASSVLGNTIDGSIASGDIVINNVAPAVAAGTQPAALADPAGIRFVDYCAATYANGGATDIVTNVVLNGETINLTNGSGQGLAPAYYTYYNSVNVPDLFTGSTYPISITFGTDGTQYAGVWIDFNQNGLFDVSEFFAPSAITGASGTATFNIVVPTGAVLGNTRMRVRGGDDNPVTSGVACGASNSVWGETEDYIISIIAPPNCSTILTWPATAITATSTTVCSGSVINFGITVQMPSATGITYRWRRNATIIGSPTTVSTNSIAVTLSGNYDVQVLCNGTPVVTSTAVALTVNSPAISGTTPAATCGPGSVTLSATGTGSQIRWYSALTGGTLLATGGSYVTPILSATTPYYAAASNLFGTENGGRPAVVTPGGTLITAYGIQFTAASDLVLNNVVTYPTGTGDFIVALYNSAGVEINATPAIAVTGGAGTAQTVSLGFDVAAGVGYRLLLKSSSGITQMEREFVGGFPYNSPSGDLSVTSGWNGSATSGAYYYFYNLNVSRICVSTPRTLVNATYNTPPNLFLGASPSTLCLGQTAAGLAAGSGYTTYTWSGGTFTPVGTGANKTLNPSASTTYTVTATGGGCTNSASVSVVVNPSPTNPVISSITPAGAICLNSPGTKAFVASSNPGGAVTVFNEGFNTAGALSAWTLQKGGSISNGSPLPDWSVQLTPLTYSTSITNFSVSTPASGFAYINSDALGNGTYTSTFASMASPSFSTVGYSSMVLTFRHVIRTPTFPSTVQYSTDGGATWSADVYSVAVTTPAQVWNAANIQTVVQTVNLPAACDNQANLKLRFRYVYDWDWFWMIDDIAVAGTPIVQYQWSSNFAFAGIPAPAQSFDNANSSMTAQPTQGGSMIFTVNARNANGCLATTPATHTTTASDVVIAPTNTGPQRENTNLVISTTATGGFGGYTYQWRKLPSVTVVSSAASFNYPAALVANSGDYQVTVTDGQGCSAVGTTEALVYAALVWNGSQNSSWTNPLNWTPNLVPQSLCAENVVIPSSPNPPVFPGPAATVGNFGVEDGGVLTLNANLNVCGAITGGISANTSVNGVGILNLTGSGTQTVAGRLNLDKLVINKPSGQVNFNGTLEINDLLTISNSNAIINVNASGNVVLKSTSGNTGKVGPVPAGTSITVNSPGKFTQERFIPYTGIGRWYLLGSPMTNRFFNDYADDFKVVGLSTAFGGQGGGILPSIEPERSTIFKHVETSTGTYVDTVQKHGWRIPGSLETIANGQGFRVFIGAYDFANSGNVFDNQGLFHFGNKTFPALRRTTTNTNCQFGYTAGFGLPQTWPVPCVETNWGWNLLSNPYPSPIDWDAAGWTKPAGMNNAFFTWNAAGSGYQAYVGSGGTALGNTVNAGANANIIGSSQGFFVKVTSGDNLSLQATEAVKSTTNGSFFRTAVATDQVKIRLTRDGSTDVRFDGMIRFDSESTFGMDINKDLDAFTSPGAEFSLIGDNGESLWLNTIPVPAETKVMPMNIAYGKVSGSYSFTFLDGSSISNGAELFLKDNYLGTLTSMNTSNETYSFVANMNDGSSAADRFEIVISPSAVTGVSKLVNGVGFGIYPNPSSSTSKVTLAVGGAKGSSASVVIVDVVGKVVYTDNMTISQDTRVSEKSIDLGLASGVYTVKVITSGKTFTDKLVVR